MIDQFNDDFSGWARFSDDRKMRYRLARSLIADPTMRNNPNPPFASIDLREDDGETTAWLDHMTAPPSRCVFVMLNPSTADAFKPDPTVGECIKRASMWGFDVVEVVNLFALRTPYPKELISTSRGQRGEGTENIMEIVAACRVADLVVYGWGNDGALGAQHVHVRRALDFAGITPMCMGRTKHGFPKHPLARGKHRIPANLALDDLELMRI